MVRYQSPAIAELQPISAMNITPLIDVMLVLLVTLIVTLPTLTHEVPIGLPKPGIAPTPPVTHHLAVGTAGDYRWDGIPLADHDLGARLKALTADPAHPLLMLDVAPSTRYEQFDRTIATIKRAGVTKLGFVGNDRWARW